MKDKNRYIKKALTLTCPHFPFVKTTYGVCLKILFFMKYGI